ncbi:YigZ family protein [Sulfidibacter corallicola]|uniref:YigZ family protein n=1 Tax=Sulfidibacter corallicola TaxID=2818388 RepID=A0A8A4TWP5_SULCO|nr:YigZ family protein [Sulfidibacter corallicola]QTD53611.1 YigZ family protein [Sulfidibacter corallicola]
MSSRFPIPAQTFRFEEEIQRSRFITTVAHAPTSAEAHSFIATLREEFADATHNCWAFLAGPPGTSGQVGMSDDGEPHGTAGRPMLAVLTHSGVGEIVAVVTRYYGGTKLGKGGLVRAYSSGVQQALQALPTKEKVTYVEARLMLGYSYVTQLKLMLTSLEVEIDEEEYELDASFRLRVPEERWSQFQTEIEGLTNGQALLEPETADR